MLNLGGWNSALAGRGDGPIFGGSLGSRDYGLAFGIRNGLVHKANWDRMRSLAGKKSLASLLKAIDPKPSPTLAEFLKADAPLLDDESEEQQPSSSSSSTFSFQPKFNFGSVEAGLTDHNREMVQSVMAEANAIKSSSIQARSAANYASLIQTHVPRVEAVLSLRLIPMDTLQKAVLFFSALVSRQDFAPRSWVQVPGKEDGKLAIRWGFIHSLKSALVHYHRANAAVTVLESEDREWKDFWRGLKKRAVHVTRPKTPIAYTWVNKIFSSWKGSCSDFQNQAIKLHANPQPITDLAARLLSGNNVHPVPFIDAVAPKLWSWALPSAVNELALLRRKAFLAVAFFGVRRNDEVRRFRAKHIIPAQEAFGFWVYVPDAKNDRYGLGNKTFIPSIPSAGVADPVLIMGTYFAALASWKADHDRRHPGSTPDWGDMFAFPVLNGKRCGGELSPDHVRKEMKGLLTDHGFAPELPSARKGGASWYAEADRQVSFLQGGWIMKNMLDMVYAPISPLSQAERATVAAKQLHADNLVEAALREIQVALTADAVHVVVDTVLPRILKIEPAPTIPTSRALVMCPDFRLLFAVPDIVMPCYMCRWFCGSIKTASGRDLRPTDPVRVSSTIRRFVSKEHVIVPATGGIMEFGGIYKTVPVEPEPVEVSVFSDPKPFPIDSSHSLAGAKRQKKDS